MKRVLAFLMALLFALGSYACAETYYCFGDEVNIRPTASTHMKNLGFLYFGDPIEIDYFRGEWAYSSTVKTEDIGGWVHASWLSLYMPELVEDEVYIVNHRRVNVRKSPNGEQIKRVGIGHEVIVTKFIADQNGDWWAETNEGWIMYEFLSPKEED